MSTTLKRLLALPDVFDLDQVEAVTGLTRHAVRMMLSRAHADGLVAPAGPRSGVYYNFVRSAERQVEAAARLAIPSAIAIGPSALHWHHATSQRSHLLTVSWLKNRRRPYMPAVHDVIAVPRSIEWYRAIAGHITPGPGGIPVLDAAYAIADMRMNGGEGDIPVLEEGDIDLDDADLDEADIEDAIAHFRENGIEERRPVERHQEPRAGR